MRPERRPGRGPFSFLQAAVFQWVNPKGIVAAVSAIALFVRPDTALTDFLLLIFIFGLFTILATCARTAFGAALNTWLRDPRFGWPSTSPWRCCWAPGEHRADGALSGLAMAEPEPSGVYDALPHRPLIKSGSNRAAEIECCRGAPKYALAAMMCLAPRYRGVEPSVGHRDRTESAGARAFLEQI